MTYNVSPKLRNGGDPYEKRLVFPVLREFAKRPDARFKFVVSPCRRRAFEILNIQ